MKISNHDMVGNALELLKTALQPYVEQEMKTTYGEKWIDVVEASSSESGRSATREWKKYWDVQRLLVIMWNHWDQVFGRTLGHVERSIVSELRETRKRWAHQDAFPTNDAHRALDSIERLLTAISAAPQSAEVGQMRMDLLQAQYDAQGRKQVREASIKPTEGRPVRGLKPWREVATPHPDVVTGRYQQAEFAADLWQVYLGEGTEEYRNPSEFFRRTYITEGLKHLLGTALMRLSGTGGDPVVELQTNFGGGKTHSLLALYHLFSGDHPGTLLGIEELLGELSASIPKDVRRVVVVGTKISPGQPLKKPDGTVVRTLWGEIAWQLGGKEAYEFIREDDERATSPGDRLKDLFNRYSPCLILIDEWVAYARQLHEGSSLPAGTFETQFTFAQVLSESAKAAKNTMLVVSIPSSDNEIGGEWGRRALERLKNVIGRVESPWRPASPDEGFEIVRRRLFEPLANSGAHERDAVASAFVKMYESNGQEFPSSCGEGAYERRIKMAYPVHPELFDRLYNDWSSLDKFQRTRGVLRLMAAVIHSLWSRQDSNLLIMPATIPIDDPAVQYELTRYLDDQWTPVIEKDVDGPNSLPITLDREVPNLGRYSVCRRVARAIYMGSAPTLRAANRGIDERSIRLACVQPGEMSASFGDGLRRLSDRATYLFFDGTRYWYSTQPSVTRIAEDRAARFTDDVVADEIRRRLKEHARNRGDFSRVHVCAESADVPDEYGARLVVLDPKYSHTGKGTESRATKISESKALEQAKNTLAWRGTIPRTYRNNLVFLAADLSRLSELQAVVRQHLAWNSIVQDKESLNLDEFQRRQAESKAKSADESVEAQIPEAYNWLLVPAQNSPSEEVKWELLRPVGQDELAVRASKKLRSLEMLVTDLAGSRLRMELDGIPLWRGDHVEFGQLVEDFCTYIYLSRIKDEDVLKRAVTDGMRILSWEKDGFAYATSWDESAKRYTGLQAGSRVGVVIERQGLIVKPDVALKQIESETPTSRSSDGTEVVTGAETQTDGSQEGPQGPEAGARIARRFYGIVRIDPIRMGRDVKGIADEIVQHLSKQTDAEVEITLEIHARLPEGVDEKTIRDVTENCRTLKFQSCEFEKEEP